MPSPPTDLDKTFAQFLKNRRGEMSYAAFSKVTGFTASSLFPFENLQQSITLSRLHGLMKRLKVSISDIFEDTKK